MDGASSRLTAIHKTIVSTIILEIACSIIRAYYIIKVITSENKSRMETTITNNHFELGTRTTQSENNVDRINLV